MAEDSITKTQFYGGISPFQKVGVGGTPDISCRFAKNINIHEDVSYITLTPKATKVSGSTVIEMPKWAADGTPHDTNRYFYDEAGNLYKETSGGTWSLLRATATIGNGAAGQGLDVFDDFLYYATSTTLGRYGKLSGTPAFNDDFLSDGTTNVDQELVATGSTYTLATSIAETATHRQTFTPTRDPLKAIIILVASKGTGDFTVTVHDSNNVSVGTATVVTANITGSANNTFTFSTPLRLTIGNEYHFHVTVSTGTSTVTTNTASDLETVDFQTIFGILVADTNFHPIQEHLNGIVIGNEHYLAYWDLAIYNPNRIVLAPGFNVRSLTKINEFVVAECWRGTDINGVEEGRRYYWDGTSPVFNFYEDIPVGLPNAVVNTRNRLIGVYGSRGGIYIGNDPIQKIQDAPKLVRGKKVEVYPGAITSWQGRTYIGYSASTDDGSGLVQGVYEYGASRDGLPEALTLAYTISTGTVTATTLKIGMVKAFGNDLYIGWDDNGTFGVDKVSKDSNPATSGSFEDLIFDNNAPQKDKLAKELVITFEALQSGDSVTPKYRINRTTSFTTGTAVTTVGATKAILQINKRFKEIEYGLDLATTNTYPIITSIYFVFDDLREEDNS